MFERMKAIILFRKLLGRPDISKAYAMVGPEDSWYDTISKVHQSLDEVRQLPHKTVQLQSHDGLTLQGVYYPNSASPLTVICVHGYTSHAEREFPGLFYHSLGFNVLIPYQRAHGPSQGKYISFGALEQQDMMGWVGLVNKMTPGGSILIHGLSMGGGIVLNLSEKDMPGVKCLIADAPNVSITEVFQNVSKSVFKKGAHKVYPHLLRHFRKVFGVDAACFEGTNMISRSKYPLLLAAGSNENMEDLFDRLQAACPQPTERVILPGCNHGNGMYKQTERFQSAIKAFLSRYLLP